MGPRDLTAIISALWLVLPGAAPAHGQAKPGLPAVLIPPTQNTARIRRGDCRWLVEHEPGADVAYTPGVDAHGRLVAPADLPGGVRVEAPEVFVIDLDIDLERFSGLVPPIGQERDVQLGVIELRGNRAYLNGQPLYDPEQAALVAQCRDLLAHKPR